MAEDKSQHAFEIDLAQVEAALAELEKKLAEMERAFAASGATATQHLQGMDNAARTAAGGMDAAAASGQRVGILGTIFGGAAGGVMSLVRALSEASHFAFLIPNSLGAVGTAAGNLLGRITPLGPATVKAFSDSLPAIKSGLNQVALFDSALKALTGRLGVVGAAMGFMQARAAGVGTGWAMIGTSAGLAMSATVAAGRAGIAVMRSLTASALAAAGSIGAAFAPIAAAAAPVVAALAAMAFVAKGIGAAANFEKMQTSFRTLVGDVQVADKAIRELQTFADVTPFQTEEVVEAGRNLVAFGFAAGELKPLLTDIGDLAAGANQKLTDVGRAFGRIRSGDFGEAFERLRDFGISRQDLEGQGLKFDAGGSYQGSASQAIEAVRQVIRSKFGGSMDELSRTWSGLWSTLASKGTAAFRALGEPVMHALKPVLDELIKLGDSLIPLFAEFGVTIAAGLRLVVPVIRTIVEWMRIWAEALAGIMKILSVWFGFRPVIPSVGRNREARPESKDADSRRGSGKEIDWGTSTMRQMGGGGTIGLAALNADPMTEEARRGNDLAEQQLATLREIAGRLPGRTTSPESPRMPLQFAS